MSQKNTISPNDPSGFSVSSFLQFLTKQHKIRVSKSLGKYHILHCQNHNITAIDTIYGNDDKTLTVHEIRKHVDKINRLGGYPNRI